MSPNLTLVVVASTLIGTGTYLLLSRSLVRALMGFLLMGNGINLIFIIGSGPAGDPPIVGIGDDAVDPVPQALVLTAIVITLAMTAFVLALAHRSVHAGVDLVVDDSESARIHARAEADLMDEPTARQVIDQITADAEKPESRHHELDATATGAQAGSQVEPSEHDIPALAEALEVDEGHGRDQDVDPVSDHPASDHAAAPPPDDEPESAHGDGPESAAPQDGGPQR